MASRTTTLKLRTGTFLERSGMGSTRRFAAYIHEWRESASRPNGQSSSTSRRRFHKPLRSCWLRTSSCVTRIRPGGGMSSHDGEDLPGLGYALQLMRPPALEPKRRSSNEIFDRPRNEDFARSRKSRDPSADVHGDATDITILSLLQLAGVLAGPDFQADCPECIANRLGAGDGPRWSIEQDQGAVPSCLDQLSTIALDLAVQDPVVRLEKVPPAEIADARGNRCRPHDVRKEHGAQ